MNDSEWTTLVRTLMRAYPHARVSADTWDLYRQKLSPLQPDAVLRAVDIWITEGDRFPTIANLYGIARKEQTQVVTRVDADPYLNHPDRASYLEVREMVENVNRMLSKNGVHADTPHKRPRILVED